MYSSMMTPVCTETPKSARKPTLRDAEVGVGDQQRQRSADGRQRHVDQDQPAHLNDLNMV
jgi:hypothetical protein